MSALLTINNLSKSFTLHMQGGVQIPVFADLDLTLEKSQAIALTGPSGIGKSSLMRLIYGTYKADSGAIKIKHNGGFTDVVTAAPQEIEQVRKTSLGYVSQFLRVIPRVSTLDIVAEPLLERGVETEIARSRAKNLLERLNIPERLWALSPVTFSGGEQQRVNIARSFAAPYDLLMLDEPTASLDSRNQAVVLDMIMEARDEGAGIIAIFHSVADRDAVCNDQMDLSRYAGMEHV